MTTATAPIHAVVDGIPAVLPELSVELPDGRTGYYQQGNDPENGCFRAAVATYTQVPFDEVGPVSSLRKLEEWAGARGRRVQLPFGPRGRRLAEHLYRGA